MHVWICIWCAHMNLCAWGWLDVGAGLNSCPPQDQYILFSEVYLKILIIIIILNCVYFHLFVWLCPWAESLRREENATDLLEWEAVESQLTQMLRFKSQSSRKQSSFETEEPSLFPTENAEWPVLHIVERIHWIFKQFSWNSVFFCKYSSLNSQYVRTLSGPCYLWVLHFLYKIVWKYFIPGMQDGSLAIKPDELNSFHRTYMVEGKNRLSQIIF